MKYTKYVAIAAMLLTAIGCTRIGTGEVGVRTNFDKTVEQQEIPEGSMPQTVIGTVTVFPVRDIAVYIENAKHLTKDDSALADFDMTVVYNINPSSVSELWTKKSKGFHAHVASGFSGDILLMHNYVKTLVNNAAARAVRKHTALDLADNRVVVEEDITQNVREQLKAEQLDTAITITAVQIRNILPNAAILQAATDYVKKQNDLRIKLTEEDIAKAEARRMNALSSMGKQSIDYMDAVSRQNISEAIKAGKVNTIVIPQDFKGIVNVK